MIASAEQSVRLRSSDQRDAYSRATKDEAPLAVWLDVIERFPDMREWVAHHKKVPLEVLELLSSGPSAQVTVAVAMKRKPDERLFEAFFYSGSLSAASVGSHFSRHVPRQP